MRSRPLTRPLATHTEPTAARSMAVQMQSSKRLMSFEKLAALVSACDRVHCCHVDGVKFSGWTCLDLFTTRVSVICWL
jgi:hypothetical protein